MKRIIFLVIMLYGCSTIPHSKGQIDNIIDSGILDRPMTTTERSIVKGSLEKASEEIKQADNEVIEYREKAAEQTGVNKVLVFIITGLLIVVIGFIVIKFIL